MPGIADMIKRLSAGPAKKTGAQKSPAPRKTAAKKTAVKVSVRDLGDPFKVQPVREHSPMRSPFHETQRRSKETPHKREPLKRRSSRPEVFQVIQNHDELDKAKFVCKAIDRNGRSPYTHVLHVEQTTGGSLLVATDGKRLHVAQIKTRIPEGDYKVLITKDAVKICNPVDEANFPDWQRVVPETAKKKGSISLVKAGGKNADYKKIAVNEAAKSIKQITGASINPEYIASLAGYSWYLYATESPGKPLLLFEKDSAMETYAVIMPLTPSAENTESVQGMHRHRDREGINSGSRAA
ncbi:hypothetical protein AGMMS49579_09140 [Spirochaetia bacterium]|nr:hypothetical protein AGMMS49579_09140 [Spirochaetia bacterium]